MLGAGQHVISHATRRMMVRCQELLRILVFVTAREEPSVKRNQMPWFGPCSVLAKVKMQCYSLTSNLYVRSASVIMVEMPKIHASFNIKGATELCFSLCVLNVESHRIRWRDRKAIRLMLMGNSLVCTHCFGHGVATPIPRMHMSLDRSSI